jgi:hypothetical protein
VTRWASERDPLTYLLALAIAELAIGALRAIETRGKQSIWSARGLLVMMPIGVYLIGVYLIGVYLGTLLRLRVEGAF